MNRSIWVPAIVCLLAFAALYAVLNKAVGVEGGSTDALAAPAIVSVPLDTPSSSVNEAELVLGSLRDKYLQRCRDLDNSPHRIMSRAAPRAYSPSCAEVVVSPNANGEHVSFLLATISLRWPTPSMGRSSPIETIPCVVHPTTKQVRLFHGGQWLTDEEWLKITP